MRADGNRLQALTGRSDADIEAEVAGDPMAAPITGGDSWRGAELIQPDETVVVSLRVERAVADHFKGQGTSMEAAMAAALKAWAEGRR
ncbi:hypothetical protein [Caenispirillum bisanense]|uniref:hypothetical protein n=1 Tax=Caenispirillum bisanense TaxID=414052 RepID=UPI0031DE1809